MRRLLPFPLMSGFLLVLWLLLNQSLSVGQLLLGTAVAIVGGWSLVALEPPPGRIRRPGSLLRLAGLVLVDIVRSNIAVGLIVLGAMNTKRRSGFIRIPLEIRSPYGLAVLACIITSTPGTLWVSFDRSTGMLMMHILDLIDEREWERTIKTRYEKLLLEIFE